MSSFSQFFDNNGQGNAITANAGNILAGIRPPAFWEHGNSSTLSNTSIMAENFPIPGTRNILGININSSNQQLQVATWQNSPIWLYNPSTSGEIHGFVYSQAANVFYLGRSNTVYSINMNTGALTSVVAAPDCFTFYEDYRFGRACYIWADPNGQYQWYNPTTKVISKYSSGFAKIQTRVRSPSVAADAYDWYYSIDTSIRVRVEFVMGVTGSASTVTAYRPVMVIERVGSRRVLQITARDVFSARYRDDVNPISNTPLSSVNVVGAQVTSMAPVSGGAVPYTQLVNGIYYGSAVRLGNVGRGSVNASDCFLVERSDYDRWLNDVADALGMPRTENFYGDWVDV